jgi:hypothetical protein
MTSLLGVRTDTSSRLSVSIGLPNTFGFASGVKLLVLNAPTVLELPRPRWLGLKVSGGKGWGPLQYPRSRCWKLNPQAAKKIRCAFPPMAQLPGITIDLLSGVERGFRWVRERLLIGYCFLHSEHLATCFALVLSHDSIRWKVP